MTELLFIKN